MALDREMATFQANLPALLEKDAGRYVLIHGHQIAGVWHTKAAALEEGYRHFILEPFLVPHTVPAETNLATPARRAPSMSWIPIRALS